MGEHMYSKIHRYHMDQCKKRSDTRYVRNVIHQFMNMYTVSGEFRATMIHTLQISKIPSQSDYSLYVACKIFFTAMAIPENSGSENSGPNRTLTASIEAKVRYAAGMCLGKILYNNTEMTCRSNNLSHKPNIEEKKVRVISLKKHVFNSLLIAELDSQMPDILSEIVHRQTQYGHLTIVENYLGCLKNFTNANYKCNFFSSVLSSVMDSMFVDIDISWPSDLTPAVLHAPFL